MATFFYGSRPFLPTSLQKNTREISKQKMFSVIPLFPQNSCPLANALEIQIASFEVVNYYIGLWSC